MPVPIDDYGNYETAWCPGCGNFGILEALKKALVESDLAPHQVLIVSGIGQAAKAPHYMNANMFNGLHGRTLPVATAAKIANHALKVICTSGDGCNYAEGGNHFLHALRRNVDITVLVHNNRVYGLTQGQASPTSDYGFVTKTQPFGSPAAGFNPVAVAVAMKAAFVARGFSGDIDHLSRLIREAVAFRGLALVDILQPCVSFNRVNTFAWYKQRVYELPESYDPHDWESAMKTAYEWGDKIPVGIIFRNERPVFEEHFPALKKGPLLDQSIDTDTMNEIMKTFA
jgi:2-oxoglutarate ferredoxin oxidoreductase subunit beta